MYANKVIAQVKESPLTYDDARTYICDKLHECLQSMVSLSVISRNLIGNDTLFDILDSIEDELKAAKAFATSLATNSFYK